MRPKCKLMPGSLKAVSGCRKALSAGRQEIDNEIRQSDGLLVEAGEKIVNNS
jgi:hypothetical protein